MRRTPLGSIRSPGIRALICLVLTLSVGILTAPGAHQCPTSDRHAPAHHESSDPHPAAPLECSCIGAACHLAPAHLPVVPAVPPAQVAVLVVPALPAPDLPEVTAPRHLLPYAHAPPADRRA
jgi:hypothetical protein